MFEKLIAAVKASNMEEINNIMAQISEKELMQTDKQGFALGSLL